MSFFDTIAYPKPSQVLDTIFGGLISLCKSILYITLLGIYYSLVNKGVRLVGVADPSELV